LTNYSKFEVFPIKKTVHNNPQKPQKLIQKYPFPVEIINSLKRLNSLRKPLKLMIVIKSVKIHFNIKYCINIIMRSDNDRLIDITLYAI
jgi:hypothetical protein